MEDTCKPQEEQQKCPPEQDQAAPAPPESPATTQPGAARAAGTDTADAEATAPTGETGAEETGSTPEAIPAPEPSDTQPCEPDVLCTRLERIEKALDSMGELAELQGKSLAILEDRATLDRARETAVQKMHEELVEYRQKGVENIKKSALQNLLVFHDHLAQCIEDADDGARDTLEWLYEVLLETLFREDVEPMELQEVAELDRERHKVVRSVTTDDPDLNRKVARVVKKGFLWHGTLLRREHVETYRYEAPPAEDAALTPGEPVTEPAPEAEAGASGPAVQEQQQTI